VKRIVKRMARFVSGIFFDEAINRRLSIYDRIFDRAFEDSSRFVEDHIEEALLFRHKYQMWDYVCVLLDKNEDGVALEFGVYKGKSINYMAKKLVRFQFFGFDSFEGLPEDWHGTAHYKGSFDVDGNLPPVEPNVNLVAGWYEDTVPTFLKRDINFKFVHLDCDLYASTYLVLENIVNRLELGDLLLFDDFLGYVGWKTGQYRALIDVLDENGISYKYIAFSSEQALVEIS